MKVQWQVSMTAECNKGWNMVRAAGLEPARDKPNGFSYLLRLLPPRFRMCMLKRVWGLDYPFTVAFAVKRLH